VEMLHRMDRKRDRAVTGTSTTTLVLLPTTRSISSLSEAITDCMSLSHEDRSA
jgi:hypothetical protein